MSALATVRFSNLSSRSFTRDIFGLATPTTIYMMGVANIGDSLLLAFAESPNPSMPSGDGETMEVDSTSISFFSLEDLSKAEFEIFCVWIDQTTNWRFGVKIHVPVQILGIGTRPYYFVMSDNAAPGTTPNWTQPSSDPSQGYSWNNMPGITISASTDSEHTSLSVSVDIDGGTQA
jgi:hypothetical protein